ncbi:hypothetical protein B484DRAFT_482224, partial [Ochromonadaceae sp. CCMP2298]
MDWSSIERNILSKTDPFANSKPGQLSVHRIDSVKSLSYSSDSSDAGVGEVPLDENRNPTTGTALHDWIELQKRVSTNTSRVLGLESTFHEYDYGAAQVRRIQEAVLRRVEDVEHHLQEHKSALDETEQQGLQRRVQRMETHVDEMEEDRKHFQVRFASKDAVAALREGVLQQLRGANEGVEAARAKGGHACALFEALARAFVSLDGRDNRHQLDLVTTFNEDVNPQQLTRILTDSVSHSIDTNIQQHLQPAMALVQTSMLEVVMDLRDAQDRHIASVRASLEASRKALRGDVEALVGGLVKHTDTEQPVEADDSMLREVRALQEQMGAILRENAALRQSLEQQGMQVSEMVTAQHGVERSCAEWARTASAEAAELRGKVNVLQREGQVVSGAMGAMQESVLMGVQLGSDREAAMHSRLSEVQRTASEHFADLTGKVIKAADQTTLFAKMGQLQGGVEVNTAAIRQLEADHTDTLQQRVKHTDTVRQLQCEVNANHHSAQAGIERNCTNSERNASLGAHLGDKLEAQEALAVQRAAALQRKVDAHTSLLDAISQQTAVLGEDLQQKGLALAGVQAGVEGLRAMQQQLSSAESDLRIELLALTDVEQGHFRDSSDQLQRAAQQSNLYQEETAARLLIRTAVVDKRLQTLQDEHETLQDKVDFVEAKAESLVAGLVVELRAAVDLTAQMNRRVEVNQAAVQKQMDALEETPAALKWELTQRLEQVCARCEESVQAVRENVSTLVQGVALQAASAHDAVQLLSHSVQPALVQLAMVQAQQAQELQAHCAEVDRVEGQTGQKIEDLSGLFQDTLEEQSGAHRSTEGAVRSDLAQLLARVALLEQLIRFGNTMDDFVSQSHERSDPISSQAGLTMTNLQQKVLALQGVQDLLQAEALQSRLRTASRMDQHDRAVIGLRAHMDTMAQSQIEQCQQVSATYEKSKGDWQIQLERVEDKVQSLRLNLEREIAHGQTSNPPNPSNPPTPPTQAPVSADAPPKQWSGRGNDNKRVSLNLIDRNSFLQQQKHQERKREQEQKDELEQEQRQKLEREERQKQEQTQKEEQKQKQEQKRKQELEQRQEPVARLSPHTSPDKPAARRTDTLSAGSLEVSDGSPDVSLRGSPVRDWVQGFTSLALTPPPAHSQMGAPSPTPATPVTPDSPWDVDSDDDGKEGELQG